MHRSSGSSSPTTADSSGRDEYWKCPEPLPSYPCTEAAAASFQGLGRPSSHWSVLPACGSSGN